MSRTWIVVAALVLVACPAEKNTTGGDATTTTGATTSEAPTTGGDATTTTGATGATTSEAPTTETGVLATCSEHTQTDACCCFEDIPGPQGWDRAGTTSACGGHLLCPSMRFDCVGFEPECEEMTTEDEAAVDCVLQALVDGASGRVSWNIVVGGGVSANYVELDLVGDGTLFRQGYYRYDLCWDTHEVQRLSLPAPAYYEGCLAETGWRTRFDCLRAAPFTAPLETCISGTAYTSEQC